jgi:hypothetical protein
VALHHAAGPTKEDDFAVRDGTFNQGIPIAEIVADLKAKLADRPGVLAELGLAAK